MSAAAAGVLEPHDEPAVDVVAADFARALVDVRVDRQPVVRDLELPVRAADDAERALDPGDVLRAPRPPSARAAAATAPRRCRRSGSSRLPASRPASSRAPGGRVGRARSRSPAALDLRDGRGGRGRRLRRTRNAAARASAITTFMPASNLANAASRPVRNSGVSSSAPIVPDTRIIARSAGGSACSAGSLRGAPRRTRAARRPSRPRDSR